MADSMKDILHPEAPGSRNQRFPHAPESWSEDEARRAAKDEGLELEADHWAALGAIQEYFAKAEVPRVRELHDALGERFHAKGGMRYLYQLFPGGPVAQGCRLAGLKAPAGSTDHSFGSVQ